MLADAIEQGGGREYNVDQLRGLVASGAHELLVAIDDTGALRGAATVSFINYPAARVAFVTAIAGRLISSQDTWDQLVQFARYRGATSIQGAVRESVARLWRRFGFSERHRIVEVQL